MNVMNNPTFNTESRSLVDRHGVKRVGAYMHTANGYKFFPFDPKPADIYVENIAHHLATQGRWGGATRHKRYRSKIFLSVAEHSVYVYRYTVEELKRPDLGLEALLHDAPEHIIGDLIRPLKYSPAFRAPYLAVEELNDNALAAKFNLVWPFPPEIKKADEAVCQAENEQCIFLHPEEEWETGLMHDRSAVAPYQIQMLNPFEAKEMFLVAYHECMATRELYRPLPTDFRV